MTIEPTAEELALPEQRQKEQALRESIIHGPRNQGWSRIDAENEADDRIEALRTNAHLKGTQQ